MVEKDYKLYGTKILNLKTQEIGLLICLWENKYADKTVDFATCVDKTGKRYNIELDNIRGFEDDFEKYRILIYYYSYCMLDCFLSKWKCLRGKYVVLCLIISEF